MARLPRAARYRSPSRRSLSTRDGGASTLRRQGDNSVVRADSGFYTHAIVAVCKQDGCALLHHRHASTPACGISSGHTRADWTPIPYRMEGAADVAETIYVPFQDEPDAAPVRLIVRRVKPTPGPSWPSSKATVSGRLHQRPRRGQVGTEEAYQRRHAEIENAMSVLKYGSTEGAQPSPLSRFPANGAWLLQVQVWPGWTARIALG